MEEWEAGGRKAAGAQTRQMQMNGCRLRAALCGMIAALQSDGESMSGTWLIRAAVMADAPALAGLLGQLGYPTDTARAAARLAHLLDDPDAAVLVACRGAEVGGLATLQAHVALNRDAPSVQLTLLVVADGLRGAGLGRELVAAAEDRARRHGADRLVLTTAAHRAGAHAFYERLGYVLTGRRYAREL